MACVASIHLAGRIAQLDDGSTVPITALIDYDGAETTDETQAMGFVCGSEERGWFSDLLRCYARATLQ